MSTEMKNEQMEQAVSAMQTEMEALMEQMKGLGNKELMRLHKSIADEFYRRAEQAQKAPKAKKVQPASSVSSGAKGHVPVHLRQNHEWTAYVRDHSRANGWPSFTWNKDAKVKVPMPCGEKAADGHYVYPTLAAGHNEFTDAHAMSLAAELRASDAELWTTWESTIYQMTEEERAKRASQPAKAAKVAKANQREEMSFEGYVASVQQKVEEEEAKKKRMAEKEAKKAAKAAEAPSAPKAPKAKKAAGKEVAVAVSASSSSSTPSSSEKTEVKLKTRVVKKAAVAAESAESEAAMIRRTWVKPMEGGAKTFYYIDADGKDVECFRDDQDGILAMDSSWVGQLNLSDFTVDTSAPNPFAAEDDAEDDE